MRVSYGGNVTFRCNTLSTPTWSHNLNSLKGIGDIRGNYLVLHNVDGNSEGTYQCRGTKDFSGKIFIAEAVLYVTGKLQ